jgi:hypothetical protein
MKKINFVGNFNEEMYFCGTINDEVVVDIPFEELVTEQFKSGYMDEETIITFKIDNRYNSGTIWWNQEKEEYYLVVA